jgi:cytochrome b involved in lipid metabolism
MKKALPIIIIIALVAVGAGAFALSANQENTPISDTNTTTRTSTTPATNKSQDTPPPSEELASYTLEQVAERDSKDDCWTIIDGSVYNITAYIPRHPGGDEILLACGEDGSSLFNQRTTNDGERIGSGSPHSRSAARSLEAYKIGTLQR